MPVFLVQCNLHTWRRDLGADERRKLDGHVVRHFLFPRLPHDEARERLVVERLPPDEGRPELGDAVVESRLPQVGQPRSSHYEGEGYVTLRMEETQQVVEALKRVITKVQLRYR